MAIIKAIQRQLSSQAALKPFSDIPGLSKLAVLRGAMGQDQRQNIKNISNLWKTFGDMIRIDVPFRPPLLILFDPDHCEKVYRAAGSQPLRPGFDALKHVRSQDGLTNQGAQGLLTSSGDEWQTFRFKVQQPMLRPKSTLRYTPELESIVEEFIEKKIKKGRHPENNQVGPQFLDEMYKWSLESVSCLALNTRLGCLEDGLPEDSQQMQIIRAVSLIFNNAMHLDNGPQMWRFLPYSRKLKEFEQGYLTFKDLCSIYIRKALNDIQAKDPHSDEDPSLLELFFARGCDESTAIVMALDMMFAGIDTSSHTSAYAMYQLAKHPKVQEKLYQEVKAELPTKDSHLDTKALDRMPYLRAVIKETLRTNPPAAGMARILPKPFELNGYQCPANTTYVFAHYQMGMSPRFVNQPENFKPERWLRDGSSSGGEKEEIHPFAILPFGHGSRMCIGRRFAEQEVSIFLTKIIQHFSIEWHHSDMGMITETITKPSVPLRFTFIDRT